MNKLRIVLLLMILLSSQFLLSDRDKVAYAQQTSLNDAVPAVVRILGCNVAGCNVGLGSGVLIHASGVVLTANHVTLADLNDPTSQLEDFLIEMTTSTQLPPQARYRARLIAFKPESDLALLRIYWDEIANQAIDVTTLQDLPTLPLANAETIMLGEEVHILGYPLAGGRAINYAQLVVGGFDEGGALIKVSTTLSEGNSGGPALVERNGRFEIAGIVLRRRGTLGEIGFIRRIDQLQEMIWLANAQRVWVDNIQVSTQGTGATASLQISAEIHALDMVNRHIYLLAYAFEATTYLPWRPSPTGLPKSATGQVVFSQAFVAQQVIAAAQTMTLEQHGLGVDPQQLRFRLLLWDSEATQVLWQDTEWRSPQPATAVALAPPPPTATQTVSATPVLLPPTPTETPMPPTATATMTPLPDLIASATAIAQMVATAIAATQTALPTNTPTATATPNLAATTTAEARRQETAIAATLTAQPAATPTATQTPSFDQVIATAVAATLTALPADTPTRMPTTTPTTALTSTRTPLPTKAPTATWTPTRTPTRTPTLLPCKPGVLYCEDFEDGQASGWRVSNWRGEPSSGWKVSRDNTNYVFTGEGHQWATLDNRSWDDYRFSFRLKLIRGTIHLIYRLADGRYYVGFNEDGLYLNKSLDNGPGFNVYSAANTHTLETWHQVELVGWGGHLQVYVDGRLELDYVDSNPLLKGMIAFETLDGSAAQIDDIEVAASGPEQVSSQTSTPGLHPELVIDAANLNVREGPGSSYKVLGVAKSGERYTITGRNGNSTWWQIDFNGRSGWVSGGYVRLLNPEITVPTVDNMKGTTAGLQPTLTSEPVASPSTTSAGTVWNNPIDGTLYVYVPAGGFLMGSANIDAEAQDDEKPQHTVYLDGFWIMRTEVTNAEYKQCVNANACSQPNNDTWDKAENGQYPVTDVNWNQANVYTKWVGGRLPTEAEWEKAARSTDGRIYPWGNTWDGNRVNFCDRNCEAGSRDNTIDDGYARTSPVGAYPKGASPYGAVDMAGNVWEWVADWYAPDYYKNSPERNPLGPETGNRRILCGGAWNHPRNDMRVAVRFHNNPSDTHNNVGFRVVHNDSSEGRVFTDPKAYQTVISQLKIPTLVDFESIDTGSVTNTITDRTAFNGTAYVDQGITFFNPSGLPLYIAPGGLFWNSSNSLSVGGFPYDTTPSTDDRLLVTFEPSVLAVGFTIIDHDPENQNSSIQFLDANDQVVKESPIPPDYAPFRAFIGIVSVDQPIARIRILDYLNDGDDVNYDDFIFVR